MNMESIVTKMSRNPKKYKDGAYFAGVENIRHYYFKDKNSPVMRSFDELVTDIRSICPAISESEAKSAIPHLSAKPIAQLDDWYSLKISKLNCGNYEISAHWDN